MNRFFLFILTAAILCVGAFNASADAPGTPFPDIWSPDLKSMTASIERRLQRGQSEGDMSQGDVNDLTSQLAVAFDAELAISYAVLWNQLEPKDQKILKANQTQWLKKRAKLAHDAASADEGGTLATYDCNMAFIKETRLRLKAFEMRLADLSSNTQHSQ